MIEKDFYQKAFIWSIFDQKVFLSKEHFICGQKKAFQSERADAASRRPRACDPSERTLGAVAQRSQGTAGYYISINIYIDIYRIRA